jgi:hypothetical protein
LADDVKAAVRAIVQGADARHGIPRAGTGDSPRSLHGGDDRGRKGKD